MSEEKLHNIDDLLMESSNSNQESVPRETSEVTSTSLENHQEPTNHIENEEPQTIENKSQEIAIDEYGNEVLSEQKMISYEEHQRLLNEAIRKRIKNWPQEAQEQILNQPHQPIQQQTAEGEVDWQKELKDLVKNTMAEAQQEAIREAQRQESLIRYQEFEGKFNNGASKYQDFQDVVMTKPLSPAMLQATQNMNDPAAFVYAACKTQPQEIDRIAKIQDPIQQAVEVGKLEERMRKVRLASKAAPPMEPTSSDVSDKRNSRYSNIDQYVHEYEQKKRRQLS